MVSMSDLAEPTAEQCTAHEEVGPGIACWYPQMGGYVAKAIVIPGDTCADVYVWHDGSFPFTDDDPRGPAHLHHCSGEQFIEFGKFLTDVAGAD
jgi:hypothetical protein